MATLTELTIGTWVRDRWWPWTLLKVVRVTKSSVWVRRYGGVSYAWDREDAAERYDLAHLKFLEVEPVKRPKKTRKVHRGQ